VTDTKKARGTVESAFVSFEKFIEKLEDGAPEFAEAASKIADPAPCESREDIEAWAMEVLNPKVSNNDK